MKKKKNLFHSLWGLASVDVFSYGLFVPLRPGYLESIFGLDQVAEEIYTNITIGVIGTNIYP